MFKKKHMIAALGIVSVFLGGFFFSNALLAQGSGEYDPWLDLNDDGIIDVNDLHILASIYSTSGTPINKTERLLELEDRIDSLNASLLTDYYEKSECDSLFAPSSHMHSGSDISGGTLNVDQINISSTTRYYTISATAWLPLRESYVFYRQATGLFTYTAGDTYWFAPVNLPHGAIVTEIRAWVYDNHGTDIDVMLYGLTGTGIGVQMASVSSSGAIDSYRQFSTSSIFWATIDNQNYAYVLWGILRSGDAGHELSQVRITYTIDEPLP